MEVVSGECDRVNMALVNLSTSVQTSGKRKKAKTKHSSKRTDLYTYREFIKYTFKSYPQKPHTPHIQFT